MINIKNNGGAQQKGVSTIVGFASDEPFSTGDSVDLEVYKRNGFTYPTEEGKTVILENVIYVKEIYDYVTDTREIEITMESENKNGFEEVVLSSRISLEDFIELIANTDNSSIYIEIDTIEALNLMSSSSVQVNATYRVRMQLGTEYETYVYLKGLRPDLISNFGERWFLAPKKDGYNDGYVDSMMNTWRGIMIVDTTYNKGDIVIWGGRVWKCDTVGGAVGAYNDSMTPSSDFVSVGVKDDKYYDLLNHSVVVDFTLDKIIEESDNKGNKVNLKNITDFTENFYTDAKRS